MKIDRICFNKIGPFENTQLDFSKGQPGLHVVFGDNEAGKSSALRYFSYFFFGIPSQNSEDFTHEYKDFSIQAALLTSQGDFDLIRQKKKKDKELLLANGSNGKEILDSLLGPVREEEFQRLFGINQAQIRHGARDLLSGEGDLAKALFEAGSGMHDLGRVQITLDEQIAEGFANRKSSEKPINATIERYKALKDEADQARLENKTWKEVFDSHKELVSQAAARDKEITDLKEKQAHSQRIIRVLPNLTRRKSCQEKLKPLNSIPLVKEIELAGYESASKNREITRASVLQMENQSSDLNQKKCTLIVNERILDQEKEIDALNQSLGQLDSLLADMPKRAGDQARAESDARKLSLETWKHDDLDRVISLLPTQASRNEMTQIRLKIDTLAEKIVQGEKKESEGRSQLQTLEKKINTLNAHPQKDRIQALAQTIKVENLIPSILNKGRQTFQETQKSLEFKFLKLAPWRESQEKFLATHFPSRERIQDFANRFQVLEGKINDLTQLNTSKQEVLEQKKLDLGRCQPVVELPTMEELLEVRKSRGLAWKAHEAGTSLPPEVLKFLSSQTEAREAFLALVARADELADRIMADGERVGTIKQLKSDIQSLQNELETAVVDLRTLGIQQNSLQESWKNLWKESGIADPGSPVEMGAWLARAEEWKQEFQKYLPGWLDFQELEKQQALLFKQGLDLISLEESDLETAWLYLENFLKKEENKAAEQKGLRDQSSQLEVTQAATRTELDQLKEERRLKEEQWGRRLLALELPPDSESESVRKYLADMEAIDRLRNTASDMRKRVEKIQGDISLIQGRLSTVLQMLQYENISVTPQSIRHSVEHLVRELEKSKKARDLRQNLLDQLENVEKNQALAGKKMAEYEGTLNHLARLLGNVPIDEVAATLDSLRLKARSTDELAEVETALSREASGENLDSFCSRMEGMDDARVQMELEKLGKEIRELEEAQSHCREEIGGRRKELETLEKKQGAYQLASAIEGQKSLCLEKTREFAKAVLAKIVLKEASRIYREENEDPVLACAKTYFKTLTLGNYTDIVPNEVDEKPVLQVIRKDDGILNFSANHISPKDGGNTVLSDGTADQLFLALRLAAIEQHLKQVKEPIPIILDDILIQFDDARAVAALDCLAKLSEKTQVILFTHHKHLGELIKDCKLKDRIFFQTMPENVTA